MKKKCYIAILMLVLTASTILTGCKGAEREAVSEELVNEETEEDDSDKEEVKETDDGEKEKPDKGKETVVPVKATRGTVQNNMFVNETFGICFPVTEDMILVEDSEILEILGADAGFLEEGEAATAKEMEDALGGTVYDAVIYLNGNSNVMISYENLDVTMDGNYPDERRYVKSVKDALDQKPSEKYEIKSQKTVAVGDVQYLRVDLNVETEGNELREIFYCRRVENYMVCITVTFEEEKRELAEAFIDSLNGDGEGSRADDSRSVRGTVADGFYTNETFGIRFPITDNMSIMSERDMAHIQGAGSDYMENEGVASAEQMEKANSGTLYDLAIYMEDGVSTISVCYENMDITNPGLLNPDEERYGKMLKYTLSQIESLKYEFREDSKITLGGKEYYRMDFNVNAMGVNVNQIYIFRREENYMISFIISYKDEMEPQVEDFFDSITEM